MINISQWFRRQGLRPLSIALTLLFLGQGLHFIHSNYLRFQNTKEKILNQVSMGKMGLAQHNRALIEHILVSSVIDFGALKSYVCHRDSQGRTLLLSYPEEHFDCVSHTGPKQKWWFSKFEVKPEGMEEYHFVFFIPWVQNISSFIFQLFLFASAGLVFTILLRRVARTFKRDLIDPLTQIHQAESTVQIRELAEVKEKLQNLMSLKAKEAVAQALHDQSLQLAHDLRAPLSVIRELVRGKSDPGVLLRSISRLEEICEVLLNKNRAKGILGDEVVSLSVLVDHLLQEKKIRPRQNSVQFEFDLLGSKDLFYVRLNPAEFKRALSALLDNAIEAIVGDGLVKVSLMRNEENCLVTIADNGQGMGEDLLSRLGEKSLTVGKARGNGLGVHFAKSVIQKAQGSLVYHSVRGQGTQAVISIPHFYHPRVLNFLRLTQDLRLAVIDDHPHLYEHWLQKMPGQKLRYLSAFSEVDLEHFDFFLVDFHLPGQKQTGMDFIIDNHLQERAVLVSSQPLDDHILELLEKYRINFVPKDVLTLLSVEFYERSPQEAPLILIDDDPLMGEVWRLKALEKERPFHYYQSWEDLSEDLEQLPADGLFYVDHDLGGDLTGPQLAKKLYEQGHRHIVITTGHQEYWGGQFYGVEKVVGKDCPL